MPTTPGKPVTGTPTSVSSATPSAPKLSRRRFLLSLSAGGAGAAAVAAASSSAIAVVAPAMPDAGNATSGYRETEHVRDYYRTARI